MKNASGIHRVPLSMEMADITGDEGSSEELTRHLPGLVCPAIPGFAARQNKGLLQREAV